MASLLSTQRQMRQLHRTRKEQYRATKRDALLIAQDQRLVTFFAPLVWKGKRYCFELRNYFLICRKVTLPVNKAVFTADLSNCNIRFFQIQKKFVIQLSTNGRRRQYLPGKNWNLRLENIRTFGFEKVTLCDPGVAIELHHYQVSELKNWYEVFRNLLGENVVWIDETTPEAATSLELPVVEREGIISKICRCCNKEENRVTQDIPERFVVPRIRYSI